MTLRWVKDPKVEHHLKQLGIRFETATVLTELSNRIATGHYWVKLVPREESVVKEEHGTDSL